MPAKNKVALPVGPTNNSKELVSKIIKEMGQISGCIRFKDSLWHSMNNAGDKGDIKGLLIVLRQVRGAIERQKLVQPAWREALEAVKWMIAAENERGHKGQRLFDAALRVEFVEIQDRIKGFITGFRKEDNILMAIGDLVFQTNLFVWDGEFCRTCGEPIPAKWHYCPKHFAFSIPYASSAKKPHSTAPRFDTASVQSRPSGPSWSTKGLVAKKRKTGSATKRGQNRGHIGRTNGGSKSKSRNSKSVGGR